MQRTVLGLRKDLQMKREDYAENVGIKLSSLTRYEQFKQVPPVDEAEKIATYHGLKVEDIKWTK